MPAPSANGTSRALSALMILDRLSVDSGTDRRIGGTSQTEQTLPDAWNYYDGVSAALIHPCTRIWRGDLMTSMRPSAPSSETSAADCGSQGGSALVCDGTGAPTELTAWMQHEFDGGDTLYFGGLTPVRIFDVPG
jgi:hypothetical protein